MKTPDQCWNDFIELLNERQQIRGERDKKTGKYQTIPHQNFLGSISAYKKLFIEANRPGVDLLKHTEAIHTLEDATLVRIQGQEMTLHVHGDKVLLCKYKNNFPVAYLRAPSEFGYGQAHFTRDELQQIIISGNFSIK